MKTSTFQTAVITIEEMVSDLTKYFTKTNSISNFINGQPSNLERFKDIANRYDDLITEWVNLCADHFYEEYPEVYHILVQTNEKEEGFCRWVCSWLPEDRRPSKKDFILPNNYNSLNIIPIIKKDFILPNNYNSLNII